MAGHRTYVFVATIKIDPASNDFDRARLYGAGQVGTSAHILMQDVLNDPTTEVDELKIIEVAYP
jgi:hypothetical protein